MRRARPFRSNRPSRHTVRIPCQVVRESDFTLVADSIEDLSVTGCLVTPSDPVITGERLIISFKAPLSRRYIDAECTVTRVLHGRRPGEYRRALGLAFDPIDGFSRRLLEANLPWWPVAPPSWRTGRRDPQEALERLIRSSGGPAPTHRWTARASALSAPLN